MGSKGKVHEKPLSQIRQELRQRLEKAKCSEGQSCFRVACKMQCRKLALQRVNALAGLLYPLENTTKLHKDMLLADLLARPSDGSRALYVGGLRVCSRARKVIFGIGCGRSARLMTRKRVDARFARTRARGSNRRNDDGAYGAMYSHLWNVYCSLAETFPDEPVILNSSDPLQRATPSQAEGVQKFQQAQKQGRVGLGTEDLMLEPTDDLPVRHLPPGAKRDQWWTYLATFASEGARPRGSYRTLLRVWHECFNKILKIRRYSHHPCCETCTRLKEGILTSAAYADKLRASRALHDHHERQWRDRMVYWRMRSHAHRHNSRWIVLMIDGADQAKFRIMKCVAWPKNLEGEHRPHMKVVGCWAHARELSFNFFEEDTPLGNNITIECLARALDRLLADWRSAAHGTEFPAHLWVQADNAGGENKNTHVCKFLALLVDRGVFRSTVASFLQVGHTHEDLDGLFSIMTTAIQKMQDWDDPMQMVEAVQRRMTSHMESRIHRTPVKSGMLHAVRDWRLWLKDLDDIKSQRGLEGLMTSDCHWLCFCRRRDLHPDCAAVVSAPGSDDSPDDVVLQIKRYMSDSELSQPPFVMLRAGASVHLQPYAGPGTWQTRTPIDNVLVDALNRLCKKVLKTVPSRAGVVGYLQRWMAAPRVPPVPPICPAILTHSFGTAVAGGAAWQVFGEALRPDPTDDAPRSTVVVKRCRGAGAQRHADVALPAYVEFRVSQGVSVHDAVQEWNGGQVLSARP